MGANRRRFVFQQLRQRRDGLGSTYTADQYDDWKDNFGSTLESGAASVPLSGTAGFFFAVPEPKTANLLAIFIGFLSPAR